MNFLPGKKPTMHKKTNYFSHDSNSRNDSKILAVRIKYGVEGYGIYFMILERLREESDYMCIKDYNSIAFDLRVESSKVKSVVEDFGLFIFTDDGKYFYSESFMKRMEFKDEKSKKASESANKRWEKEKSMRTHTDKDADALQTDVEKNASKVKKSKVKKSKVLSDESPRTQEEIILFQNFENWIQKNTPRVNQLKEPLTIDQYFRLKQKVPKDTLTKVLKAMQNRADLLKKYVSAYLTILNWSSREDVPVVEMKPENNVNERLLSKWK